MTIPGFGAAASLYRSTATYHAVAPGASRTGVTPQASAAAARSIFDTLGGWWCKGGCFWDYGWCRVGGGSSYCDFRLSYCLWKCDNPTPGEIIL